MYIVRLFQIKEFKSNYHLRTWTTGCYYYSNKEKAWIAVGMSVSSQMSPLKKSLTMQNDPNDHWFIFQIKDKSYRTTICRSSHLTSFGGGFFVQPNTIDFDYVFAHASFQDNITIYLTIIITLIIWLIILIWAK